MADRGEALMARNKVRIIQGAAAALVVALALLSGIAYALLTVNVNKTTFVPGDTLVITGKADPNAVIVIAIKNPNGDAVAGDQITADANGNFQYAMKFPSQPNDYFPAGTYTIVVKNANTGEVQQITVQLQQAGAITGTVVDEKGNPVSGAQVEAYNVETGAVFKTTTNDAGEFTLYVNPGTYMVKISKAGYFSKEIDNVAVEIGKTVNLGKIEIVSISYKIGQLEKQVSSLAQQLAQITSTLANLNTSVSNLDQTVSGLKDSLGQVQTKVSSLEQQLGQKADKADLEALSKKIDEISKTIDQLKNALSAKADKQQLDALQQQLANIKQQLDTLQNQVSSQIAAIQDALNKKADMDAVEALKKQLENSQQQLSKLQEQLNNLANEVNDLKTRVANLEQVTKTIDALRNTVKQLQDSLNQFNQKADQLQKQIQDAADKASSASSMAMAGLVTGVIGIIIAVGAVIMMYRKIAA